MAISKGKTFTDNEQVTAAKLHQLVDNATIDALAVDTAQLAAGAVTNEKIASGAGVSLNKVSISSGALAGGSVSNAGEEVTVGAGLDLTSSTLTVADDGVTTAKILDNNVTVAKLPSTITFASGNTVDMSAASSVVHKAASVSANALYSPFLPGGLTQVTAATGDLALVYDTSASANGYSTIRSILDAGPSQKWNESATGAVASGVCLAVAHGYAAAPTRIRGVIVCTDVDYNVLYSVGDEVDITAAHTPNSGWWNAFFIVADDTYIRVIGSNQIPGYLMMQTKNGQSVTPADNSNFAVKLYYAE